MKTSVLVGLLLALGALPAHAGDLKILAPRDQGLVLGKTVEVEVAGAAQAPECWLDGSLVHPVWTPLPWAHRWVADLPLASVGPHDLEVVRTGSPLVLLGGRASAHFESTLEGSVALGDRVAHHLLATTQLSSLDWQWGPAVLLYGLDRFAQVSTQHAQYTGAITDYYAKHAAATLPSIDRSDLCSPGGAAVLLWMTDGVTAGLPAADRCADWVRTEPRNALGALDHLGAHSALSFWATLSGFLAPWAESIWVDSLFMYGLFAVDYGDARADAALLDFGAAQPGIFAAKLQDPTSGLFTHAWDVPKARPLGVHWLRGNGWVATTIVEMLSVLPAGHPERPALLAILTSLAQGLMDRQLASGLWDSIVDHPGASYEEASGSALVAYALAKGAREGYLPASARACARHAFEALTARLHRRTDGCSVTGISGATNPTPAWIYPLIPCHEDVDYGVGAFLLLAAELENESWL
jgi:unsaturated rhamnogalacturonyl hydrolase